MGGRRDRWAGSVSELSSREKEKEQAKECLPSYR